MICVDAYEFLIWIKNALTFKASNAHAITLHEPKQKNTDQKSSHISNIDQFFFYLYSFKQKKKKKN